MTLDAYLSRKGLSQAKFAALAGCSQGAISHLVTGRRAPSAALIRRLVAATGGEVTANDLLGLSAPSEAK